MRPTHVWRKQLCDFCLSGERRSRCPGPSGWLSPRPRGDSRSRPFAVWCACKRTALRCSILIGNSRAMQDTTGHAACNRPYPDQFALKQHVTEARDRERTLCHSLNARVQHAEKILEVLYTKFKSGLRCTQIKCCVMIRRNDFKRSADIACREGGMRKGLWRVTGASGSKSGSFILTLCNTRTC